MGVIYGAIDPSHRDTKSPCCCPEETNFSFMKEETHSGEETLESQTQKTEKIKTGGALTLSEELEYDRPGSGFVLLKCRRWEEAARCGGVAWRGRGREEGGKVTETELTAFTLIVPAAPGGGSFHAHSQKNRKKEKKKEFGNFCSLRR